MKATLFIAFESSGQALPIARVENASLLVMAAQDVINRSRIEAQEIGKIDTKLGFKARAAADGLSARMATFIPGLIPTMPDPAPVI